MKKNTNSNVGGYRKLLARTLLLSTTGLLIVTSSALAADAAKAANNVTAAKKASDASVAKKAEEPAALEEIITVGTRVPNRSLADTPAPVDIFSGEQITHQGGSNMNDLLSTILPSFNVGTQPNSGTATSIRPANLRGLSPDSTLVLINGKRRHHAAIVVTASASSGLDAGSQGTDISLIPAIALKQIQVLRDGASAQYGSDAIAGVIDFDLRDDTNGGIIEAKYGKYYAGDGATKQIAATYGTRLGRRGHLNVSAEFGGSNGTSRTVQPDSAKALIAGGNTAVADPVQVWGSPKISNDFKVFLNMSVEAGDNADFYAFGGYASKRTDGTFYYRNPNNRSGVFTTNADPNGPNAGKQVRLVGDLTPADGQTCVGGIDFSTGKRNEVVAGSAQDIAAIAAAKADPNCFVFNELFPGGFTPSFGSDLNDISGTTGLRGKFDNGLRYDVSMGAGRNEISFDLTNGINPSLGPNTPLFFKAGSYIELEKTGNLDLSYPLEIKGLASPLNIAGGLEWHEEQFQIVSGDAKTFAAGILGNPDLSLGINQGFGARLDGFAPFRPEIAGKFKRHNVSGYLDLEADVIQDLTLGAAVRYEHFSDFGGTTNFKFSGLYHLTNELSIRSTYSTGFRAPTIGQENFSSITTTFGANGNLVSSGTVPSTSGPARLRGGKQLQPEKSNSISAGLGYVSDLLTVTVDYFNIKMRDRITFSKKQTLTAAEAAQLDAEGFSSAGLSSFNFFTNDFSSTTQGVDIVATIPIRFNRPGSTNISFAGNWTDTKVTSYNAADPTELLSATQVLQLEKGLPKYRANATLTHSEESWRGLFRINYYGPYTEAHLNSGSRLIDAKSEVTLDAEIGVPVQKHVEIVIGAQNLLNNYPAKNPYAAVTGAQYGITAPQGFNGGFYYAKLRVTF